MRLSQTTDWKTIRRVEYYLCQTPRSAGGTSEREKEMHSLHQKVPMALLASREAAMVPKSPRRSTSGRFLGTRVEAFAESLSTGAGPIRRVRARCRSGLLRAGVGGRVPAWGLRSEPEIVPRFSKPLCVVFSRAWFALGWPWFLVEGAVRTRRVRGCLAGAMVWRGLPASSRSSPQAVRRGGGEAAAVFVTHAEIRSARTSGSNL